MCVLCFVIVIVIVFAKFGLEIFSGRIRSLIFSVAAPGKRAAPDGSSSGFVALSNTIHSFCFHSDPG